MIVLSSADWPASHIRKSHTCVRDLLSQWNDAPARAWFSYKAAHDPACIIKRKWGADSAHGLHTVPVVTFARAVVACIIVCHCRTKKTTPGQTQKNAVAHWEEVSHVNPQFGLDSNRWPWCQKVTLWVDTSRRTRTQWRQAAPSGITFFFG